MQNRWPIIGPEREWSVVYIEVEEREGSWFVQCGELWADHLTKGEALEVIASLLFTGRAPYVRTTLQNWLWDWHYGEPPKLLEERCTSRDADPKTGVPAA
jgi:hypothetical protein